MMVRPRNTSSASQRVDSAAALRTSLMVMAAALVDTRGSIWAGALFVCLLAGMQTSELRHDISQMCARGNSFNLHACRDSGSQNSSRIIREFRKLLRMPLDSDSLGSLRIDRARQAPSGGGAKRLIYMGGMVVALAAVGVVLWKFFGGHTTEVTTV